MSSASKRRRLPGLSVREGFLTHPFDEAHAVHTSGLVAGRHLKTGHTHDRHVTAYYGVAPSVFHSLVARWRKTKPCGALEDTTFIDIGAGMGRAMLLASEMPFRKVLGVELHPALLRAARRNLAIWRKAGRARTEMRLAAGDAVEFVFPPGPCVAFLFNPFGAVVMKRWLRAVSKGFAQRPGELDILLVNNEQEGVLEEMRSRSGGAMVRLFLGQIKRSRADKAADDTILGNQPDGEYASAPHEDCSIWRWAGTGSASGKPG